MTDESGLTIEQLDEPFETAGGRLKLGYWGAARTPVYFDPDTGLSSFGCGTLPVVADDEEEES